MRYCTLLSATGCPALSVAGGFSADGLPVGLQVVAAPRAGRRVLEVAQGCKQAAGFGRRRSVLS
jgi:amidase